MLLRLGQPCVFAQSCFCDRTSDDMKLSLSSYHLQGLFTWLFGLTMLVSVPWMPRYTGLCAALQALQVGLICLLSSEFAVTSVIWKQTRWIHVCVFFFSFLFFFLLLFLIFLNFSLFYFTILYWFYHISTWIHHGCTQCSQSWTSLPILPLWVIPVHQPQASCILHRT